jgi:hypothetical protein
MRAKFIARAALVAALLASLWAAEWYGITTQTEEDTAHDICNKALHQHRLIKSVDDCAEAEIKTYHEIGVWEDTL